MQEMATMLRDFASEVQNDFRANIKKGIAEVSSPFEKKLTAYMPLEEAHGQLQRLTSIVGHLLCMSQFYTIHRAWPVPPPAPAKTKAPTGMDHGMLKDRPSQASFFDFIHAPHAPP